MTAVGARTLPSALASGPALHALVRIELTNGTIVVGRLLEMDAATMNLKIDAITSTAVRRRGQRDHAAGEKDFGPSGALEASASSVTPADTIEVDPVALRCIQGMVVRGGCVRFLDFLHEGKDGGSSYGEVEAAGQQVRPSE